MNGRRALTPWLVLIGGGVIGVGGWILVINLLGQWPISPDRDLRPWFFASLWLGVAGTCLPLIWFLHRRFGRTDAGEPWHPLWIVFRQSLWAGAWVALCAWLQMHGVLNWAMGLLLMAVLALLEALLQTRREAELDS